MIDRLLAEPGVEERSRLRSTVGFIAPHGGSLELMTDVIAEEAGRRAGASFYTIRQPRALRWHIPSNRIDPSASTALKRFVDHVDVAIAVHGWGADALFHVHDGNVDRLGSPGERPVVVGGSNRKAAEIVARHISRALPAYSVLAQVDQIPASLRGVHPRNIVNRPRNGGVQLELPPRIRGLPPFWKDECRGRNCPDTQTLIDALATAARQLCA